MTQTSIGCATSTGPRIDADSVDTEAIQNLEDIQDYIAEDDPLAAFEMVN